MVKITPCVDSKLQSSTTACLSQSDVNDKLQQTKGNCIPPVGVNTLFLSLPLHLKALLYFFKYAKNVNMVIRE